MYVNHPYLYVWEAETLRIRAQNALRIAAARAVYRDPATLFARKRANDRERPALNLHVRRIDGSERKMYVRLALDGRAR